MVLNHPTYTSGGQGLGKLPAELIIEVFSIGLALAARDNKEDVYLSRISSLCQYWRSFVFAVPELWTKMCWTVDAHRVQPSSSLLYDDFLVGQAKAYLERSQELDIDVTIIFVSDGGTELTQMHLRAIFFQHLHRCRSLRLISGRASSMAPLLPIPKSMPVLQTLEIFSQYPSVVDHLAHLPQARDHVLPFFREGKCAPAVRTLRLHGEGIHSMANINVVSPYLQNIHLNLHGCGGGWFNTGGLGGILGPDSPASTLDVRSDITFFQQIRGLWPPIYIPNVTSLRIGSLLELRFRNALRLPNLRHLELVEPVLMHEPTGPLPLHVPDLAVDFKLKSLSLKTQFTKRSQVSRFYAEHPGIEELTVDTERCKLGTIIALSPPSYASVPAPSSSAGLPGSSSGSDNGTQTQTPTVLPNLRLIRLRGPTRTEVAAYFLEVLTPVFCRPQLHVIWEEVGSGTPIVANRRVALFLKQYPDRFRWETRVEEGRYE